MTAPRSDFVILDLQMLIGAHNQIVFDTGLIVSHSALAFNRIFERTVSLRGGISTKKGDLLVRLEY
jgi:hypothetical protein